MSIAWAWLHKMGPSTRSRMREVVVIDKSCARQRSSDRRSIHRPRKEADKEPVSNALILAEGHGLPLYLNISPSLPSAHTASPASPYVQGVPISSYALFTKINDPVSGGGDRIMAQNTAPIKFTRCGQHLTRNGRRRWCRRPSVLRPYFIKHFHRDSRGQPSSPQIANFCVYAWTPGRNGWRGGGFDIKDTFGDQKQRYILGRLTWLCSLFS